MMFEGARKLEASEAGAGELGHYQDLIALQKQIVEIAEQNVAAQRRCEVLRGELSREAELLLRSRRSRRRVRERLRDAATGIIERLMRRDDPAQMWKRSAQEREFFTP